MYQMPVARCPEGEGDMTVAQHDVIDFIVHDPTCDRARLVMVEPRPWGDGGGLLRDLQEKLNAYLSYVKTGQATAR